MRKVILALLILLAWPSILLAQPSIGGGGGGGGSTPTGTAGSPSASVVSVQGVSGGTAIYVFGADTTGSSQSIASGSGNTSTFPNGPAPSGIALAGQNGAAVTLAAGGTLSATLTPQCSFDGGTTYPVNGSVINPTTGVVSATTAISSGQGVTVFLLLCPQGSSHAQLNALSYVSGSASFTWRATVTAWPTFYFPVQSAPSGYASGLMNTPSLSTVGGFRTEQVVDTTDPYTNRVGVRITTATTTVILAASASKVIRVYGGSVCVDAGGVQTTVTLEDNSGSPIDLFSGTTTTTPYQLAPGQCLDLTPPMAGTYTGKPLTAGQNFQIVTGQAGPVNVVTYLRQD
jgi:hypothetical protein